MTYIGIGSWGNPHNVDICKRINAVWLVAHVDPAIPDRIGAAWLVNLGVGVAFLDDLAEALTTRSRWQSCVPARPARARAGRARIEEHVAERGGQDCRVLSAAMRAWDSGGGGGIEDGVAKSRALGFDDFFYYFRNRVRWFYMSTVGWWLIGRGPWVMGRLRWLLIKLVWGSFSFSISPFLLPLAWQSPWLFFPLSDEVFPFIFILINIKIKNK
jgi:hypothetical protein